MSNAPAIFVDERSSDPPSSAAWTLPVSDPTSSTVLTSFRLAAVWARISLGSVSAGACEAALLQAAMTSMRVAAIEAM